MKKINIALILVALAAQLSSNVYALPGEGGEETLGVLNPVTADSIQLVESKKEEVAKDKEQRRHERKKALTAAFLKQDQEAQNKSMTERLAAPKEEVAKDEKQRLHQIKKESTLNILKQDLEAQTQSMKERLAIRKEKIAQQKAETQQTQGNE